MSTSQLVGDPDLVRDDPDVNPPGQEAGAGLAELAQDGQNGFWGGIGEFLGEELGSTGLRIGEAWANINPFTSAEDGAAFAETRAGLAFLADADENLPHLDELMNAYQGLYNRDQELPEAERVGYASPQDIQGALLEQLGDAGNLSREQLQELDQAIAENPENALQVAQMIGQNPEILNNRLGAQANPGMLTDIIRDPSVLEDLIVVNDSINQMQGVFHEMLGPLLEVFRGMFTGQSNPQAMADLQDAFSQLPEIIENIDLERVSGSVFTASGLPRQVNELAQDQDDPAPGSSGPGPAGPGT